MRNMHLFLILLIITCFTGCTSTKMEFTPYSPVNALGTPKVDRFVIEHFNARDGLVVFMEFDRAADGAEVKVASVAKYGAEGFKVKTKAEHVAGNVYKASFPPDAIDGMGYEVILAALGGSTVTTSKGGMYLYICPGMKSPMTLNPPLWPVLPSEDGLLKQVEALKKAG